MSFRVFDVLFNTFTIFFAFAFITVWLYYREHTSDNSQVIHLPQELREKASFRILPAGDSITQSYNPNKSYRFFLWNMLKAYQTGYYNPVAFEFVGGMIGPGEGYDYRHEGHAGWQCDSLIREMPMWLERDKPDAILIHIGTNDIGQGWHGHETIAQTVQNVEKLIDLIWNSQKGWMIKIFLAQILGTKIDKRKNDYEFSIFVKDGVFHPSNEDVGEYNKQLAEMVERKNRERTDSRKHVGNSPLFPITLVDMFSALTDDSHFDDSLHPSDAGEAVMGIQWFEAIVFSEWWRSISARV